MDWWYSIPIRSHVYTYKQECIPVGCVGGEGGSVCPGGGGVCPGGGGGCLARGCLADTPSVNRMTDVCENITLPQLRCGR